MTKEAKINGEQIYQLVLGEVRQQAKEYKTPEQLELSLEHYSAFMEYLDKNPEKRGEVKELSYVVINGVTLYIIPSQQVLEPIKDEQGEEVLDEQSNPKMKELIFRVS